MTQSKTHTRPHPESFILSPFGSDLMPFSVSEVVVLTADDAGGTAAQIVFVDDFAIDQLQTHPILFALNLDAIRTQIQQQAILGRRPDEEVDGGMEGRWNLD